MQYMPCSIYVTSSRNWNVYDELVLSESVDFLRTADGREVEEYKTRDGYKETPDLSFVRISNLQFI